MFAVQGVYTDGAVIINDPVPVSSKYDVVVTFLKPVEQENNSTGRERKFAALNRITGMLSDSTITLEEARAERLSRQ